MIKIVLLLNRQAPAVVLLLAEGYNLHIVVVHHIILTSILYCDLKTATHNDIIIYVCDDINTNIKLFKSK